MARAQGAFLDHPRPFNGPRQPSPEQAEPNPTTPYQVWPGISVAPSVVGAYPWGVASFIYTMRDGKNRGTTAGTKYDASLVPLICTDGGKPSQFLHRSDTRFDPRFGIARCPIAAGGSAAEAAAGFVFDRPGFRQWFLDTLSAGRMVRMCMAIKNDHTTHSASSGGHQGPIIQTGHASGQMLFRVRYDSTSGAFESWIGENDGTPTVPTLFPSQSVSATLTDATIATKDGNLTEWHIQYTPNDPFLASWAGEKHNFYVTVRTKNAAGASVLDIAQHQHYGNILGVPTGSLYPRMPISDHEIPMGRTIDRTQANLGSYNGTIGDILAFYADDQTAAPVTNTTTIGTTLDTLWRGLKLEDVDGICRTRGRGRFRAA